MKIPIDILQSLAIISLALAFIYNSKAIKNNTRSIKSIQDDMFDEF